MIRSLIKSSRPKTLLVGIAPVLLGSAVALKDNTGKFSAAIFFLTTLCTVLMQIGTNLVNEYFDFQKGIDTDERLGPKRSLAEGSLTPLHIKRAYQICFFLSLVLGVYLMITGGPLIITIGLISLLTAYCYTGGPLPLSHYYLGEITAFIFFGPVAVIGTYFLQVKTVTPSIILFSFIPGLISAGLMSLNNLRDITTDKQTEKRTVAIYLGEKKAKIFTISLALAPLVLSILTYRFLEAWSSLLYLPPLIFIPVWKKILLNQRPQELNEGIAAFGKYNVIYCLLISILYNL